MWGKAVALDTMFFFLVQRSIHLLSRKTKKGRVITDKTVERRINREDKWISPLCLAAKGVVKAAAGVAVISTQTPFKSGGEVQQAGGKERQKRHEQQADKQNHNRRPSRKTIRAA